MEPVRIGIKRVRPGRVREVGGIDGRDNNIGRPIVADAVFENFNIVMAGHDNARACRNARHGRAGMAEIAPIIFVNIIVEHANARAWLRQAGHVEDKDAARIVGRDIAINIRVLRIFNLDARHIALGPAVADDDALALTDIDARV